MISILKADVNPIYNAISRWHNTQNIPAAKHAKHAREPYTKSGLNTKLRGLDLVALK